MIFKLQYLPHSDFADSVVLSLISICLLVSDNLRFIICLVVSTLKYVV